MQVNAAVSEVAQPKGTPAITAPAALSIVTTIFPEGKERNTALGIWGGLAGIGSAVGLIAGIVCALAVALKFRFGFDDSLDVVGVHLVGGLVGTLMIGFFGTTSVNSLGADGLFYGGDASQLGKQAEAFGAALKKAKVETTVEMIKDRDHGSIQRKIAEPDDPATKLIVAFIRKQTATK